MKTRKSKTEPALFICPTPLGNLEDITLRTLGTLKQVDFIACEDTRVSRKLLTHYEIQKELVAYHEHNQREMEERLVGRMQAGETMALVSDAGMPGINDPGSALIRRCQREGIPYTVLPGPTAFLTALIFSGLPNERFVYAGFFPRESKERKQVLDSLAREAGTTIFYETPHRIGKTVKYLEEVFPDRQLAIVREISKIYEERLSGTARELSALLKERELKGEMVLLVAGQVPTSHDAPQTADLEAWFARLLEEGLSRKDAIKEIAEMTGANKKELYQQFMIK